MEYIGIDVHQRESQVCIVAEDGRVLLERRVRTRGERFTALLEGRDRARVVLEASSSLPSSRPRHRGGMPSSSAGSLGSRGSCIS